ncbi:MAG: competence/damage-inducible protein A [Acidobacteriota bacterium]
MTAEIVAVGSEMLTPDRSDTNSLWLTAMLGGMGITVGAKHIVPDDEDAIARTLGQCLSASDLVIVCGGLGPTEDDVTRQAVSRKLRRPLALHRDILGGIEERFRRLGIPMPRINARQGMVPRGAIVVPNGAGTAPGLLLSHRGRAVLVLPGPPNELRAVWGEARPHLEALLGPARRALVARKLLVAGLSESRVDEIASPLYKRARGIRTTILFSAGQIELHLNGEAATEAAARRRVDALAAKLRTALGTHVFGEAEETLEQVVVDGLRRRGARVATAESCTGGLLGQRITSVPGSSDVYELGVVTYANWAKHDLIGVKEETLEAHGAVSEETAREMAEGVRARGRAAYGLAITGIAGPDGGTESKPVGTVYVGLASGRGTRVVRLMLPGRRESVRRLATQAALNMLRLDLERHAP